MPLVVRELITLPALPNKYAGKYLSHSLPVFTQLKPVQMKVQGALLTGSLEGFNFVSCPEIFAEVIKEILKCQCW